ncbi:MAG: hypothetical protein WBE50_15980 [Methyloceanibacter sp.]
MNRTAFAYEGRPEFAHHPCGLNENAPEALGELAVVGGVNMILAETNRVPDLVWQLVNANLDAEVRKGVHEVGLKVDDGSRKERDLPSTAVAGRRP